ncbi:MAG: NAD(P)/FAD-dependent oxidoreductase [Thermoplasmata archaeon]|nr:MAG: NAD(P)/FAD-dependent oxidoreductase [Thermoplasmata archaeon]
MHKYDLAVVGGGPAGITAAVQACRSDLKVALFEADKLGGLLHNANLVENYPSGRNKISGIELVEVFKNHLENFPVELVFDEITAVELGGDNQFELKGRADNYTAKAVIVAAGTVPNKLKIPGMESVRPERIHYEVKSLQPIPEGKSYVIIGGGDAAFDYALQLARYKGQITILVRADFASCLPLLERRVREKNDCITLQYQAEVVRVEEDEASGKMAVYFKSAGSEQEVLEVDFLLIAVGRKQNSSLIETLSHKGTHSIRTELNGKTNIPGLYLAGDIMRGSYRQVGIAVGDGLRAAMMAAEYLRGVENK